MSARYVCVNLQYIIWNSKGVEEQYKQKKYLRSLKM